LRRILGDAERRPHGTKILPFEEAQHERVAVGWIQLVDDEGLGPVRPLRPQVLLPASLRNQRILLRIDNSVQIQIHVQLGPKKMLSVVEFYRKQLEKRRLAKPGKLLKIQEVLAPRNPKPKAMGGHV
jgi:hypothetical protein